MIPSRRERITPLNATARLQFVVCAYTLALMGELLEYLVPIIVGALYLLSQFFSKGSQDEDPARGIVRGGRIRRFWRVSRRFVTKSVARFRNGGKPLMRLRKLRLPIQLLNRSALGSRGRSSHSRHPLSQQLRRANGHLRDPDGGSAKAY